MGEGKLIVIDGTDGSGKATQTRLLLQRLKGKGQRAETMSFPRYSLYSACFVERYLKGEYGSPEEVGPYRASLFYAMDRYAAGFSIRRWLDEGAIVVLDRYVSSNMGHQGGKIKDLAERKAFLAWVIDLEYHKLGLPMPDLSVLLHVPSQDAMMLARRKWGERSNKAVGMGNVPDIHERDPSHLADSEEAYLYLLETEEGWEKVACVKDGALRSVDDIASEVWGLVRPLLGL